MPYVAIVFRKPVFVSDSIIAMYAGQYVHTDICPIDELNAAHTLVCTCYMGETFSASLCSKSRFNDATHAALVIPTTIEEQDEITSYLYALVEKKVKYNYMDVAAAALPLNVRNTLFSDVESENPDGISSLFCSQAAVLVLRNCLIPEREITKALTGVNSRCILPNMLYNILTPFCMRISCDALREGEVEMYRNTYKRT